MYKLWIEPVLCEGFLNCQICEKIISGFQEMNADVFADATERRKRTARIGMYISKRSTDAEEYIAAAESICKACPNDAIKFREAV